jgi:FMN phosphatase YigB (HAD superfamily)
MALEWVTDPRVLTRELAGVTRIVFDLDGTLYDTRDFERPALASVVHWLRERSGLPLEGMIEALWSRRETDRHRPRLFDDLLLQYGLPVEWGAECARRFHAYEGSELRHAASLRDELQNRRAPDRRFALVTNGYAHLQERKLTLLGLKDLFDVCVYCDPRAREQLKPSTWAWDRLASWRGELPATYIGDDPVDAAFAAAGGARFIPFCFRSPSHED